MPEIFCLKKLAEETQVYARFFGKSGIILLSYTGSAHKIMKGLPAGMTPTNGGGVNMDTVDKIVNEISQKLATSIVDTTYYKVLYEESQEKLTAAQAQLEQAQARLNEVSQTLESDEALKELFDEVANKLEKE